MDLAARCVVTDKLDGSLGILYPTPDGHAIATRGAFVSEQALHATELWLDRYAGWLPPLPRLDDAVRDRLPGEPNRLRLRRRETT
jgi:hypothetical protein